MAGTKSATSRAQKGLAATALALALLLPSATALAPQEAQKLRATVSKLQAAPAAAGAQIRFKLEPSHDLARNLTEREPLVGKLSKAARCKGPGHRVFRASGKHEKDHKKAGLDLWYECESGGAGAKTVSALATFQDFLGASPLGGAVAIAEAALKVELYDTTSNDPMLADQPHYDAIKLFQAWDLERGGPNAVVQVLDTGIDMSHEDLQLNIWQNPGEICGNGIDDDNNGFVDDCNGYNHADNTGNDLLGSHWHGSHCGGTIAADTNNGIGVAGVAGGTPTSPGAKLMISLGFGTSTGGFAEALVYGADNGAQISSNSWGYTAPGAVEQAVLDAIDYYNTKDGLVVFAAGNDNSDGDYYPGVYEGTVAVAALNNDDTRASFSNYGDWIDISAPGVNVFSTVLNNGYGGASGTSMACPHVAGVLALGVATNPVASKEHLLGCLFATASSVDAANPGFEGQLGAGVVDAAAFVACAKNGAPSPAPTYTQTPTTAVPSAAPTLSLAPTTERVSVTVSILTDNYPDETTWTLEMISGGDECEVPEEFASGGPYSSMATPYEHALKLCAGGTFKWTINDAYGDGICCNYGSGSFSLTVGGVVVFDGGEFASETSHTFTTGAQPSQPTLSPTVSPAPTDGSRRTYALPDVDATVSSDDWMPWGPDFAVDKPLAAAELSLTWKDQGWGNQKGTVALTRGDVIAAHCCAPHDWATEVISLEVELLNASPLPFVWPKYQVGGGGSHELFVQSAELVLTFTDGTAAPVPLPTAAMTEPPVPAPTAPWHPCPCPRRLSRSPRCRRPRPGLRLPRRCLCRHRRRCPYRRLRRCLCRRLRPGRPRRCLQCPRRRQQRPRRFPRLHPRHRPRPRHQRSRRRPATRRRSR